jgi:hypothetical protein
MSVKDPEPDADSSYTPPKCRCENCRHLEATRSIVYAEIACHVVNQQTVDMWNKVIENHECLNADS